MGLIRKLAVKALAKLSKDDQVFTQASLPWWDWESDAWNTLPFQRRLEQLVDMNVGWVYACVSRNASTLAQVPLRLYVAKGRTGLRRSVSTRPVSKQQKEYLFKQSDLQPLLCNAVDVEELDEHPWLELLRRANPFHNGFELLETKQMFEELTGNAYWYLSKGPSGMIEALWPMPSHQVRIIKDPKKFITGYKYGTDANNIETFDPEQVAHFKFPSSSSLYYGSGPLEAARVAAGLNQKFDLFEDSVLENGAAIPFIVTLKETVPDTQKKQMMTAIDRRHKGYKKAGVYGIFDGGADIKDMAVNPKDINYVAGHKMTKEKICAIFDIPLSMMTTDDVNLANAQAGLKQYMKFGIMPRCFRTQQVINQDIMPLYDDRIFVAYDNPVPEDKEFALQEQNDNLSSGVTVINEVRQAAGKDDVPWGNEPWLASSLRQPSEERVSASNFPDSEDGDDDDTDPDEDKHYEGMCDCFKTLPDNIEKVIEPLVRQWVNTTAYVMSENATVYTVSNAKELENAIPWSDIEEQGRDLLGSRMTRVLNDGAVEGTKRMIKVGMSPPPWGQESREAAEFAAKYVGERITLITNETKQAVRNVVASHMRQGMGTSTLINDIKQMVGLTTRDAAAVQKRILSGKYTSQQINIYKNIKLRHRAMNIARTETARAYAEGNSRAYQKAGLEYKEFLPANDACEICEPLRGKVMPISSTAIPVHPACRCTWLPVVNNRG